MTDIQVIYHATGDTSPWQDSPIITLWVGGRMITSQRIGDRVKRWQWLPRWFPLNHKWAWSHARAVEQTEQLRRFGERLADATKGEQQ